MSPRLPAQCAHFIADGHFCASARKKPSNASFQSIMFRYFDILFSFALISGTFGFTQAATAAKKSPNIVFIFSDDHAYQAISAYKDSRKLVETPNIDRIGREGMLFQRCMVPNSICGPSRACVLTGKYNHLNGYFNNSNCKFDGSQPTFPKTRLCYRANSALCD